MCFSLLDHAGLALADSQTPIQLQNHHLKLNVQLESLCIFVKAQMHAFVGTPVVGIA